MNIVVCVSSFITLQVQKIQGSPMNCHWHLTACPLSKLAGRYRSTLHYQLCCSSAHPLARSAGQHRSSVSSGPHLSSPPAIHSSGKVLRVWYSESTVTMCQFATMFAIPCSLTAGLNSLFYDKPIISNWDQDCGRDKQVASYSSGSCAGRVTVAAGVQTMLCGFVSNVEVVF